MSHILSKDTLLDITHEALLRNWDKLQLWAWEEHEREIILREMLAQLDKWLKNNRDTQYLLSAGSLSYFEKWWTGIEVNKAMWMRRYLDGGIRHDDLEDKERKTQNAKRKKQEIEEYLADSRKYHNRKKRIQRIAIGIICLLLVTAVTGLIYSLNLQRKISVTSLSNSIATKAYRTLEKDPTLAFRLAEQAYKIAPEPLAKEVLMASYGEVPFYQVLRGHEASARPAKFSPDGQLIITGSLDKNLRLWSTKGECVRIFKGHEDIIPNNNESVNFSPDGKLVLSASNDSTARLWEVSTGKCLAVMKHKRAVSSAVFSPDGTKILTASADRTAKLWDLSGKELVVFKGHRKGVKLAKFSPDGTKILTASGDSMARLWNINGQEINKFIHDGGVFEIKISSDGKYILTAGNDKKVKLWKIIDNNLLNIDKHYFPLPSSISIDFSPSADIFLHVTSENSAEIYDYNGNQKCIIRGHTALIWQATFSKDGKHILTCSDDGTARLWDLNGTELMVLKGHTDQVLSANFSPDGNYVVTASGDNTARIWNIKPKENPVLKGHTAWVPDANFSPDGNLIVTAGLDYTARIWEKNGFLKTILLGHEHYAITNAKFINNKIITTSYGDGTLRIWDITGKEIKKISDHIGIIWNLSISDKKYLILSTGTGLANSFIWDTTGKKIQTFENSTMGIFSRDGNYVVTNGEDSTFSIYTYNPVYKNDTLTYIKSKTFKNKKGTISITEFSPDNELLIGLSEDSSVLIFNRNCEIQNIIKEKNNNFINAQFSPNGKLILTICQNNTFKIWDKQGKFLNNFLGHNDGINSADFSPDENLIASSSNDHTVKLWNVNGEEIITYSNHKANIRKVKFTPDGKYILTASDDHTARIMLVSVEMALDKINKEKVRGEVMELSQEELKVFGIIK